MAHASGKQSHRSSDGCAHVEDSPVRDELIRRRIKNPSRGEVVLVGEGYRGKKKV